MCGARAINCADVRWHSVLILLSIICRYASGHTTLALVIILFSHLYPIIMFSNSSMENSLKTMVFSWKPVLLFVVHGMARFTHIIGIELRHLVAMAFRSLKRDCHGLHTYITLYSDDTYLKQFIVFVYYSHPCIHSKLLWFLGL